MLSKACFLLPLALTGAVTTPIKHVIVLMEENRSFDHLLGHLKAIDARVNGLDASSGNPLNPLDPHSPFIPVNYEPVDGGSIDPCHAFDCATQQIFGFDKPMANKSGVPLMNGFAANTPGGLHNVPYVLSAFNNTNLPILSTLAQEFAVFDAWHCSAPTCTNPNREFMMSGTAHGMIDNTFPGPGFPQETFFNMIERRANLTWKIYYGDNTWMAPAFADLRSPQHVSLVQQYEQLFYDLGNGTLPAFSLIQPRTATGPGGISNWQHPDNSVEAGEALIARVYTALKASKYWDSAALVITYDENGGFYDHQPPPQEGVPPPDAVIGQNGFDYTRLGIRVPTVVVSPWIAKSTVVHAPSGPQAPTPTSQFDATSIISTSMKLFGIEGSMTARDAWAGHFEDIFTGGVNGQPRTDCPDLPALPPISREVFDREAATPLNDHHLDTLDLLCGLIKGGAVTHPVCEEYPVKGEQGKFVQGLAKDFQPATLALEENLEKVQAFAGMGVAGVTWEHLHVPAVVLLRQMHFEAIHEALWNAFKTKVLVLFDVDGTLTPSRKVITPGMKAFLKELRGKVRTGMVGGSDLPKQLEQLGEDVLHMFDYVFPENGLKAYKGGALIAQTSMLGKLGEERIKAFVNFVLGYLSTLDIPKKRGTFIEFRTGMINVSPIGRNCSQEERDEFEEYDKVHGVRATMIKALQEKFGDYGLKYSIGGQISFDVFPVGWDKTFCLQYVKPEGFDEIHFFGDKTYEGGNDFEIFNSPDVKGHTVTCPEDTERECKALFMQ